MTESKKKVLKNKFNARIKKFNNKKLVSRKKTKKQEIKKQKGGETINKERDNFEVTAWHDIDFDKISLTKNSNVDLDRSQFFTTSFGSCEFFFLAISVNEIYFSSF
jgi:hypothetical protein